MSITLDSTSYNSGTIEVGGVQRIIFGADGGAELHQSPTQESPPKHIATMEALWAYGGMPRFTPYVWGGKASAMPVGDTQSSGQQLLDLMYPDMRADVVATQFTCPENEWQADPYKRLTHWSLGDGVSWMRPPDKNCVQPGSLEGPFFGAGVGSQSAMLGTAVLDQFQGHWHKLYASSIVAQVTATGGRTLNIASLESSSANSVAGALDAVRETLSDGVNGDPRIGRITRPRTWHGIWMIRMYGRVLNTGTLDAAGLNTRMDMLDSRVSALESFKSTASLGSANSWHRDGDTGVITQWGKATLTGGAAFTTITFPIRFPTACKNIQATPVDNVGGGASESPEIGVVTADNFQIVVLSGTTPINGSVYWKAIGH